MELPLDLHSMPSLWKCLTYRLSRGQEFRVYEDPSRQYLSLTPVGDMNTLRQWWESNASIPRICQGLEAMADGLQMRELVMRQRPIDVREVRSVVVVEQWWCKE